jgi:hypothetical protein
MDINTLRNMRNQDFGAISSAFEKVANPTTDQKNYDDNRFWKLEKDKAGNGSAVIRFLPRAEGDELPWVKVFSHGFKGPTGRWYIENSLTTLGQNDPVGELNSKLWNESSDDNSPGRKQARDQKRRLHFISNILVISDPKHPENEGKVFLFKYGKKIFDKIMNKAKPTFEDERPVNVFDLWEGANFKLRMRNVEGYPNYDESVFADPAPVASSDEQILSVVNKQYKLAEFIDPKNFKTYDELKQKLEWVLSGDAAPAPTAAQLAADPIPVAAPRQFTEQKGPEFMQAPAPRIPEVQSAKIPEINDDDEDDMMAMFQRIANED